VHRYRPSFSCPSMNRAGPVWRRVADTKVQRECCDEDGIRGERWDRGGERRPHAHCTASVHLSYAYVSVTGALTSDPSRQILSLVRRNSDLLSYFPLSTSSIKSRMLCISASHRRVHGKHRELAEDIFGLKQSITTHCEYVCTVGCRKTPRASCTQIGGRAF
jgi:hypothetical protein